MNNLSTKNTQKNVLQIIIILFVSIGSLFLVFYLFRSFLWSFFISYLLFTLFDSLNKKLQNKLKSESLSALILILIILLLVFLPLSYFVFLLVEQIINFTFWIQSLFEKKDIISYLFLFKLDSFSFLLNNPFFWVDILDRISVFSKEYSDFFNYFEFTRFIGRAYDFFVFSLELILKVIIYLILSIIILFFLFKDGHKLYIKLSELLPFEQNILDELKNQVKQVFSTIFKGNLFIAILQGVFLGIGLVIVKIPNVLLYSFFGSVVSIIPILGTSIVWIPVSLYLYFIKSSPSSAIFLAIYSLLSFLFLENVVKPKLLNKQIGIPSILLFLAILGGLKEFGITGVILGPAILALFIIIWRLYPIIK